MFCLHLGGKERDRQIGGDKGRQGGGTQTWWSGDLNPYLQFFESVCSLHFAKSFFPVDLCHWKNFLMLKAVFPSNLSSKNAATLSLHV